MYNMGNDGRFLIGLWFAFLLMEKKIKKKKEVRENGKKKT